MNPPYPMKTTRIPIFATLVVALAVAIMLALGIWQLERKGEKEAQLALYRANIAQPDPVAVPLVRPVPDAAMFRRTEATCERIGEPERRGGKDRASGATIYRVLLRCAMLPPSPAAAGPHDQAAPFFFADIGGTTDPVAPLALPDRFRLSGMISAMPGDGLLARLTGQAKPPAMLIIADQPIVAGLVPSAFPDVESVPNNHLAYAGQWFLFALAAIIIYALALRKRRKGG